MAKKTLRTPKNAFKKMKGSTLALVVVGGLVLLALIAVGLLFAPEIFQPVILTLLILALLYFGIRWGLRARQNRKVDEFDDAVAAKEGIDDRRREWASWTAELKKQGIDRYELPFYLLVGEPQSGKSVLLQNSDLYFPFGQSRLSGVGGTRGCDWWFTDEAVILDLAGRLFTHEGGASDQLEWEAFLELLAGFRPLCPANGVLLVIPCDGLLSDTPQECAEKANKIQSALLTLTKKLQAQLPIYMVLTKGDKVFGFAESVHRLDAPKRHEMFGWSRPAEKVDAPFDAEELRHGFEGMVERARVLRSEMTVSARLPEALGEVDRMFAFPEELAGIWPSLEAYVQRIFTESALADRLHFRGLYLTSGLQSGVPIARVCGDLMGGAGEADGQALEGLFSKQRAYFIKDLVRKRIFSERGLVRPTEGRVAAARRNALVGYGVSGAVALASLLGAVVYLSGSDEEVADVYEDALASTEALEQGGGGVRDVLRALFEIHEAVDQESALHEELFQNARGSFEELYVTVFDERLFPILRQSAANRHVLGLRKDPEAYAAFLETSERTALLLGEIDLDESDHRRILLQSIDPSVGQIYPPDDPDAEPFDVAAAIRLRREYGGPDPAYPPRASDRTALLAMAEETLRLWDGCLTPGSGWQPEGELGYVLAWMGIREAHDALESPGLDDRRDLLPLCDQYASCYELLNTLVNALPPDGESRYRITGAKLKAQLLGLSGKRAPIEDYAIRVARREAGWPAYDDLERFAERVLQGTESVNTGLGGGNDLIRAGTEAFEGAIGELVGDIQVPTNALRNLQREDMLRACVAPPTAEWSVPEVASSIARAREDRLVTSRGGVLEDYRAQELPGRIYLSKLRAAGREFSDRYASLADLLPDGADPGVLDTDLVLDLGRLRVELAELGDDANQSWSRKLGRLLEEHFDEVLLRWDRTLAEEARREGVDWGVVQALRAASEPDLTDGVAAMARDLASYYLDVHGASLIDEWSEYTSEAEDLERLIEEIKQHFASLRSVYESPLELAELDYYAGWSTGVDALLADRLAELEQRLVEVWSLPPRALERLSIPEAVDRVVEEQATRPLGDRAREAERLGAEVLSDPIFSDEDSVLSELPETAERLASVGRLAPTRALFKNLPFVRSQLEPLVEELGRRDLSGLALASALNVYAKVEPPRPEHCLEFFAQSLYTDLLDRALADVRERYVSTLQQVLETRFDRVLGALYADDLEAIEEQARDDARVLGELGDLLDRGGWLDQHRTEYLQLAEKPEDRFDALHPRAERLKSDPMRFWWELDLFLIDLQRFLLFDEDEVDSSAIPVTFIPSLGSGIWDFESHGDRNVRYFYFPKSDRGDWGGVQTVGRDMQEESLEWRLKTGNVFRLRWSKFNDQEPNYQETDAFLEVPGVLAPLLLAWMGDDPRGTEWRVQLTPQRSTRKAPFALEFKPRELPPRPRR